VSVRNSGKRDRGDFQGRGWAVCGAAPSDRRDCLASRGDLESPSNSAPRPAGLAGGEFAGEDAECCSRTIGAPCSNCPRKSCSCRCISDEAHGKLAPAYSPSNPGDIQAKVRIQRLPTRAENCAQIVVLRPGSKPLPPPKVIPSGENRRPRSPDPVNHASS